MTRAGVLLRARGERFDLRRAVHASASLLVSPRRDGSATACEHRQTAAHAQISDRPEDVTCGRCARALELQTLEPMRAA